MNDLKNVIFRNGSWSGLTQSVMSSIEVSVPNGIYITILKLEAWVAINTIVQATVSQGTGGIQGMFCKAYQTGANRFQIIDLSNVTNGVLTLNVLENDPTNGKYIAFELWCIKIGWQYLLI